MECFCIYSYVSIHMSNSYLVYVFFSIFIRCFYELKNHRIHPGVFKWCESRRSKVLSIMAKVLFLYFKSNHKVSLIFELFGKKIFKLMCHTFLLDSYKQNQKHAWQHWWWKSWWCLADSLNARSRSWESWVAVSRHALNFACTSLPYNCCICKGSDEILCLCVTAFNEADALSFES